MYKIILFLFSINSFACILTVRNNLFSIHKKIDQKGLIFFDCLNKEENKIRSILKNSNGHLSERHLKRLSRIKKLKMHPKVILIQSLEELLLNKLNNNFEKKIEIIRPEFVFRLFKNMTVAIKIEHLNYNQRGFATFRITAKDKTHLIKTYVLKIQNVYMAKKDLEVSFKSIIPQSFKRKKKYIKQNKNYLEKEINLSHYKLNRRIMNGGIIKKTDISPVLLIKYGGLGQIIMRNKNLSMTIKATAMSSGTINQSIKFKNNKTRKVFTAKIIDKNKAVLEL